ncbi:MAG: YegS/Rv2252/BmrU family lipid kinase [Acidobacteriota bacterium]
MNVLFLVNPRAGARRRRDVEALIRASCGEWNAQILPCDALDEVISRAIAERVDAVYAVGGDGTVHEVAKRLIGTPVALGVLPIGSGNGFARHLGLPMNPRASLRACRGMRIESIDTATVNGAPFVGTMGLGFDAWIADAFANAGARGFATYVRVGLRGFAGYASEEYAIAIDGTWTKRRALVVAVANASQYGNNARIAPLASLQDGMLDVTVVERATFLTAPLLMARLFAGRLHRARGVVTMRGRRVEIVRDSAGPAHLDGEPMTLPESLTVEIVPRSLRVVVPDAAVGL